MTTSELAARDAREHDYAAMLARQEAFERSRQVLTQKQTPAPVGCAFAKSCKLPDAIIDYSNPSGMVPTDSLRDYGEIAWLGAREVDDAGLLNLQMIGGAALGIGRLALHSPAIAAPATGLGVAGSTALAALAAVFWTPSLGDSALYTEDQLRALTQSHSGSTQRRATG